MASTFDDRWAYKGLRVHNLFGAHDHALRFGDSDRVSILVGPNGVGKTNLLRLMYAVANLDFARMSALPFECASFRLARGGTATVVRVQTGDESKVRLELRPGGQDTPSQVTVGSREMRPRAGRPVRPWVRRVSPTEWLDERAGDFVDAEELRQRYGAIPAHELRADIAKTASWIESVAVPAGAILVETGRLDSAARHRESIDEPISGRARSAGVNRPERASNPYLDMITRDIEAATRESFVRSQAGDKDVLRNGPRSRAGDREHWRT